MQAIFDIELKQPIILSRQAASAGAHQSLDYIPGSTLLGLVAGRLYAQLNAESAWTVFHSGKVRFQDALPLKGGEIGYPVPFCWHSWKGESACKDDQLDSNRLFNPSHPDFERDPNRQPVQLRSGYVSDTGRLLKPKQQQTLKTAIDHETGMAAEGQLFGYEALAPDQWFRFQLQADDDLPLELWQKLLEAIQGAARLGRSRSAQFGRVQIHQQKTENKPDNLESQGERLTLWLLSDLLLEKDGQPYLQPLPELIDLPEGSQWLPEKSFLRSRRYSAYNAYRRSYDAERQVICRGSVLNYQLSRPLNAHELQRLQMGLGLQVEGGLGQVRVNPSVLATPEPRFKTRAQVSSSDEQAISRPKSSLITALELRQQRRTGNDDTAQRAAELYRGLCQRMREARAFAATPAGIPIQDAPNRSQWGRIKELASDHRNKPADLLKALVGESDGVLRPRKGGPWELRYALGDQQTLGHWLSKELNEYAPKESNFVQIVGHLAVLGLEQSWLDCCAGIERKESAA